MPKSEDNPIHGSPLRPQGTSFNKSNAKRTNFVFVQKNIKKLQKSKSNLQKDDKTNTNYTNNANSKNKYVFRTPLGFIDNKKNVEKTKENATLTDLHKLSKRQPVENKENHSDALKRKAENFVDIKI